MATEIERVFLLRGVPAALPAGEVWRIEQGYLAPDPGEPLAEGRLRRITHADGRVECAHTVKRGAGLVREETEVPITEEAFARAWPRTEGRRLSKRRTRVREGALTWEVDVFAGLPLVLAECEIPTADTPLSMPAWLLPEVVREVTHEPAFRNYEIARRTAAAHGAPRPEGD
jgi:CYTH domain-containing protein